MRDEAQRYGFVITESEQGRAYSGLLRGFRSFDDRARKSRQRIRKLVVPVQPGDFFDQIDFAFYIKPPARNTNRKFRLRAGLGNELEAEPLENRDDLMGFKLRAENALHLGNAEHDRRLV